MNDEAALASVSRARLADDLWSLASVPSPTGHEREAALLYAGMLERAGATVEIDEANPQSPSVIGRLRGSFLGPTLQLAGHIDHIDVPHPEAVRGAETISARGAADMKGGLAAILEIVRILDATGRAFPGEILVTAYGLHEAPVGHGETLVELLRRGIRGDAAIVFEGPPDRAVVCGKGQSIWNVTLRRDGEACHENSRPSHADGLLDVSLDLGRALRAEAARLKGATHAFPLLGPESVFVGQLHYGDFYNRAPATCSLQGTWRWHPDKSFTEVQTAFRELLDRVPLPAGIHLQEHWSFVGESFAVDPEERIVRSLRRSYEHLRGKALPLAGVSSVLDTSRLVPFGKVPTVPVDCHGESGHSDREVVRLDLLEAGCALALLTALTYLAGERGRP